MRKCLLFVALLIVSQVNSVNAQSLFGAPDTVCVRQPIQLTDSIEASSYYWGFCSGYLFNNPVVTNMGVDPNYNNPGAIEVVKQGNNYFGFVVNTGSNELLKLSFGPSLGSTPVITNYGDLAGVMPVEPTDLFITKDTASGQWFMFVTGGLTQATSSIARLDFGTSLDNTPNIVNFGNPGGVLNVPRGITVQKSGGIYYGYVANNADNKLIRLTFGNNISLTPVETDLGVYPSLNQPSDIVAVYENNKWFLLITNEGGNSLTRFEFGASLNSAPTPVAMGNLSNTLFAPTGITFVRDCGVEHLFITNATNNDLTRVDMTAIDGTYSPSEIIVLGQITGPTSISHIIRDKDSIFAFVTNGTTNSLAQILFPQCTNPDIKSATTAIPPVFQYESINNPNFEIFNVYLVVNEGLPNMQVECKQITVIPIPNITLNNDTTICQGDTVHIFVDALDALSYTWRPDYNISSTTYFDVKVWPEYTTDYRLVLPYANGCVVDTDVLVTVNKNRADAGPDRTIYDGAKTILGGPLTTEGVQYTYTWLPNQFISNTTGTNPVVNPPYDFTYYLEVRNSFGCYDIDTVVIHVTCNDLNLPNAFNPDSKNPNSNRFGVMNKQIVKLNYFRVFDRWGKMVFESTADVAKQWDGMVNGEVAPIGVYVWEADGFCLEGRHFKRSGNVTLIR
jgi:hypothetical protein